MTTRKSSECPIYGASDTLSPIRLPNYEEVMKYYHHVRNVKKTSAKEPTFRDIAAVVTTELIQLWDQASIPSVSYQRILQMIRSQRDKTINLIKTPKQKQGQELFQEKLKKLRVQGKSLFDITFCKCKSFKQCNCPLQQRVPIDEEAFLTDQRQERKMVMGMVDITTTRQRDQSYNRRVARHRQLYPVEFVFNSSASLLYVWN